MVFCTGGSNVQSSVVDDRKLTLFVTTVSLLKRRVKTRDMKIKSCRYLR